MLPLSLLYTANGHPMLVELKNGDTYNGRLEICDNWMNIKLRDVIWTSRDGQKFWKLNEVFIRGNSIKYMTIPDEVMEMVNEEEIKERRAVNNWRGQRGRGKGRGPERGGRGVGRDGGRGMNRGGRGRGRENGRGRDGGRGRGQNTGQDGRGKATK